MLISWLLLNDFVDIPHNINDVADRLTLAGAEVEGITHCSPLMQGVITATITHVTTHQLNPKYHVVQLDVGSGEHKVCVTSAGNFSVGDCVVYAPEGSVLPDGTTLGVRDFLGINSFGMMLSAHELGLRDVDDPSGLLILPEHHSPGTDIKSLYHINDIILDIAITPNRGDLLSHLGVAREVAGLFHDAKLKASPRHVHYNGHKDWPVPFDGISLLDDDCSNYSLALATNITIAPSPLTVRVDLSHLGMRPINNVVDATNYIMLTLGQPLHAFDLDALPAHEITVRSAAQNELITTLDGVERSLSTQDLLITSGGKPVALAGIMGGQYEGINDTTHSILLEAATFAAPRVAQSSRRLNLHSEAAYRFARNVDPTLPRHALMAALTLINAWSGATTDYSVISAHSVIPATPTITLTPKKLHTYLSWDDMAGARAILEGFGVRHVGNNAFVPPSWRPDITIEEALIAEVGRYRGYNDIPGELPGALPRRASKGTLKLMDKVRMLLRARGYTEVMTYSFVSADQADAEAPVLANPLSREQAVMRTSLLAGVAGALKSGGRGVVRVFEAGVVWGMNRAGGGKETEERVHVCVGVMGGVDVRTVHGDREAGYFD